MPDTVKSSTTLTREELIALWDKHLEYEFNPAKKSVEDTMATMVEDCYVNHIPTMVGGYGKKDLSEFYRDKFIFTNPPMDIKPLHRIVSVSEQSIVDEMLITFTHTSEVTWLLPGIPPTGKRISFIVVGIVRFKEGKIHHEHIHWDNASVMRQAGLLPDTVSVDGTSYPTPAKGVEAARQVEADVSHRFLGEEGGRD